MSIVKDRHIESEAASRIGLIAGSGQFPVLFSQAARRRGFEVFAAAYLGEADPALSECVSEIQWLHLGQIKRLIRYFKSRDVRQAVMLGGIRKVRMFTDVRPDMTAIALMARMRSTHDDAILRAFADLLEKEGVAIRASTFLMPEMLAPEGCWTRRRPSRSERADIELGYRIARDIGRLDIGQCVVAGGGSVLAVEAVDGTDATLRRGGLLGRGNAVAVKVCKPAQDRRFDMPAVGADTVAVMAEAGVTALAVEAGRSVVFDREEMIRMADENDIALVALAASGGENFFPNVSASEGVQ